MKLRRVRAVLLHQVSVLDEYLFGTVTLRMFLLFTLLGVAIIFVVYGIAVANVGAVVFGTCIAVPTVAYVTIYVATRGVVSPVTYLQCLVKYMAKTPRPKTALYRINNDTIILVELVQHEASKHKHRR